MYEVEFYSLQTYKARTSIKNHGRCENVRLSSPSIESTVWGFGGGLIIARKQLALSVFTERYLFNPQLTNELPHHYHLDESTFNFRGIRCIFSFYRNSCKQTMLTQMRRRVLLWVYTVCLCPKNRTPYCTNSQNMDFTFMQLLAGGSDRINDGSRVYSLISWCCIGVSRPFDTCQVISGADS